MRLLIDTQCWLWWFLSPDRLSRGAFDFIADGKHTLFLSAASSWEIAIKWSSGKLRLPEPPQRYVPARLAEQGIAGLPVEHAHALRIASLPPHHADPFDRLLVAQAQAERLTLLTADPQLLRYDVETVWAAAEGPPRVRGRGPRRRKDR